MTPSPGNPYLSFDETAMRFTARKLVRCLQVHDPKFAAENQKNAAYAIEWFLGHQEYLRVQQWIGGFLLHAEQLERRGGLKNRWRAFKLRLQAKRECRRIDFGNGAR